MLKFCAQWAGEFWTKWDHKFGLNGTATTTKLLRGLLRLGSWKGKSSWFEVDGNY